MIEAVDQRLQEWMGKLGRPAEVFLAAPADMTGKEGVSLHLLELVSNSPPRGVQRPPLVISLRYLVTTWFKDLQKSHRLLGELMFAAMEDKELEVEQTSVPLGVWPALGVGLRPAFLLRMKVNKPRSEKKAPRVRGGVGVRFGAMLPLHGQVFGPGKIPIMAATITLPSLHLVTRTDYNGRFLFAAVPGEPPVEELQVNARGRNILFPLPKRAEGAPLVIELTENQI